MKRYIELFRIPNVWVLVLACFPARVAYGMVGLGIFFKVQQATGSISFAGIAIGLNAAAGSFTAGIRGSIMDKYGQTWPLRVMVPGYAGMAFALNAMHSKPLMLIFAFVMGLSAPPINLSVRPLWKIVVPADFLRTAYAIDTAIMSAAGVVGPVIATTLALSSHPALPLNICGVLMLIGGGSLAITRISRSWIPEKKSVNHVPLWKHKPLQLLMIEGCFIGFGWGVFDVAVPAFTTIEKVPHLTAWIFTAMGVSNILGGLLAGLVSKKTSSLRAMRRTYLIWFIVSIPMALTHPSWTMIVAGAFLGLVGGAIQVFYWEVMEAIRPQGSPTAMMGWLWTVEGTLMSIGSTAGGIISDKKSPTLALWITTFCIGAGYVILGLGRERLSAADRIPTPEEDLAAMEDNSPTTR
ncbi:MAG: MFS transporter [Actinomycetota bacterium]|jgi:MFS family permease